MKINLITINHNHPVWNILGEKIQSYCISCNDRPCINFKLDTVNEITRLFNDLPTDRNYKTCPTNSIQWDSHNNAPTINADTCIVCGVCIHNCPVKAIYIENDKVEIAYINKENLFQQIDVSPDTLIDGEYAKITESLLEKITTKIIEYKQKGELNPNLLVRNLLLSLGWKAVSYKEGVQYSSIDVLAKKEEFNLAVEVELDNQLIDTPRNLITYLALLVKRHQWDKNNTKLLSVGMNLPNNREEYWNVINDIDEILNIKINVSTIPYLIYLLLTRRELEIVNDNLFLTKEKTLRNNDNSLDEIPLGYLGIFEPYK